MTFLENGSQEKTLIQATCSKCGDYGYIFQISEDGYESARECECRKKKRIEAHYRRCGISDAFQGCTLTNYEAWNDQSRNAKIVASEYTAVFEEIRETRHNSLALLGAVGAGKTHLGIAVLNNLMQRDIATLYAPYREMVRELKANVMDECYDSLFGKYVRQPVLFIDDMFKLANEKDKNYVYEVINDRYLNRRPMIITSELSMEELIAKDEATGSRIYEMCKDFTYEFKGDTNYRMRG